MAWTKPAAATQTWGGGTTSSVTFRSVSIAPSAWATVSAQPESGDGGIDFEARFRNRPTWSFRDERPVLFQSSISEGNP